MKNTNNTPRIPLENWYKISPQTMDFYFAESEKRLLFSIENIKNSKQVAYRILGIVLPLVSVAIGFAFSKVGLDIPISIFVVSEAVGLFFIIRAMYSCLIMPAGAKPFELIKDDMVVEGHDDRLQYLSVLLNYCEEYQFRIVQNDLVNKRLVRSVNAALTICAVVGPLLFALTSFLLASYR